MTVEPNQGAYLQKQGDDPAYAGKESGHKYVDVLFDATHGVRVPGPGIGFDAVTREYYIEVPIPETGDDADDVRTIVDVARYGTADALPSQPPTGTVDGDSVTLLVNDGTTIIEREVVNGNLNLDAPVVWKSGNMLRVYVRYDRAAGAVYPGIADWLRVRLYYFRRRAVTS